MFVGENHYGGLGSSRKMELVRRLSGREMLKMDQFFTEWQSSKLSEFVEFKKKINSMMSRQLLVVWNRHRYKAIVLVLVKKVAIPPEGRQDC